MKDWQVVAVGLLVASGGYGYYQWSHRALNGSSCHSGTIRAPTPLNGDLVQHFAWEYAGKDWTWNPNISIAAYDALKGIPRTYGPTNYAVYATSPFQSQLLQDLASIIQTAGTKYQLSSDETLGLAVCFVQSLQYTSDNVAEGFDEYPKYPLETLYDAGGDCEDTAILMAGLLHAMGYDALLLDFQTTAAGYGHMAAAVYVPNFEGASVSFHGKPYYFIETTGSGFGVGQLPSSLKGYQASILPLVPEAVLGNLHWTSTNTAKGSIRLNINVTNQGSATAHEVQIEVGWDAGNNKMWSKTDSQPVALEAQSWVNATMDIRLPPPGVRTRLLVWAWGNDAAPTDGQSEWFNTWDPLESTCRHASLSIL